MKDQRNTLHTLTYFFQSIIDPVNSTQMSYTTDKKNIQLQELPSFISKHGFQNDQ